MNSFASAYQSWQKLNANNTLIQNAFENTLSRDGTSPNQMEANFDMNSHRILNLPAPTYGTDPMRLTDLPAYLASFVASLSTQIALNSNTQIVNLDPTGTYGLGLSDCTVGMRTIISNAITAGAGKQLLFYVPSGTYVVSQTASHPTIFDFTGMTTGALGQLGVHFVGAGNQAVTFLVSGTITNAPYLPSTNTQFADYTTYPDSSRSRFMWVPQSANTVISGFSVRRAATGSPIQLAVGLELGAHSGGVCQRGQVFDVSFSEVANKDLYCEGDVYGFTYTNCTFAESYGQGGVIGFSGSACVNHQFNACTVEINKITVDTKQYCVEINNGASDINFDTPVCITVGANGVDQPSVAQYVFGLLGASYQSFASVRGGTMIGPWVFSQGYSRLTMDTVQCQFLDCMAAGAGSLNIVNTESGFVGKNCYPFGSWTIGLNVLVATGSTVGLNAGSALKAWNPQSLTAWADKQPAFVWENMGGFNKLKILNAGIGQSGSGGASPNTPDPMTANVATSTNRIPALLDSKNPLYEASYFKTSVPGLPLVITNASTGYSVAVGTVSGRRAWKVTTPTVGAGAAILARYFECAVNELFVFKLRYLISLTSALTDATSDADADFFYLQFQFYDSSGNPIATSGEGKIGDVLNNGGSWGWYNGTQTDRLFGLAYTTGLWTEYQSLPVCAPTGAAFCKLAVVFVMTQVANNNKYEVSCLDPEAITAPLTSKIRHRPLTSRLVTASADTWPTISGLSLAPNDVMWNSVQESGKVCFKTADATAANWITGPSNP